MTITEFKNLSFSEKKYEIYKNGRHIINRKLVNGVMVFLYVLPHVNRDETPDGDIFIEVFFSVPQEVELMILPFASDYTKLDNYARLIDIESLKQLI